ncbi:hypothetical protein B0T25DRAFT_602456 [Lasiosphaeria hispida]|uniref:Uncharacterized protein n=1 Tax=Lasiosphaeria hispida TaxID=260671 RepID=A0AAJ0HSN0_9PEZI|nr:hypothetical protein B0T25DRAFT_602456 [Lasiosphaeria hispida]
MANREARRKERGRRQEEQRAQAEAQAEVQRVAQEILEEAEATPTISTTEETYEPKPSHPLHNLVVYKDQDETDIRQGHEQYSINPWASQPSNVKTHINLMFNLPLAFGGPPVTTGRIVSEELDSTIRNDAYNDDPAMPSPFATPSPASDDVGFEELDKHWSQYTVKGLQVAGSALVMAIKSCFTLLGLTLSLIPSSITSLIFLSVAFYFLLPWDNPAINIIRVVGPSATTLVSKVTPLADYLASLASHAYPDGTDLFDVTVSEWEAAAKVILKSSDALVKNLYANLNSEAGRLGFVLGETPRMVKEIQSEKAARKEKGVQEPAEAWWETLLPHSLYNPPFRVRKRHVARLLANLGLVLQEAYASRTIHEAAILSLLTRIQESISKVPESLLRKGADALNSEFVNAGAGVGWTWDADDGPSAHSNHEPSFDFSKVIQTSEQAQWVEDLHFSTSSSMLLINQLKVMIGTLSDHLGPVTEERKWLKQKLESVQVQEGLILEANTDSVVGDVAGFLIALASELKAGVERRYFKVDNA